MIMIASVPNHAHSHRSPVPFLSTEVGCVSIGLELFIFSQVECKVFKLERRDSACIFQLLDFSRATTLTENPCKSFPTFQKLVDIISRILDASVEGFISKIQLQTYRWVFSSNIFGACIKWPCFFPQGLAGIRKRELFSKVECKVFKVESDVRWSS